ncbi:imidazolonepropionase [Balneatrix alpica]|uniref:Imidazolonepropionase n=1 Tax=Balneatrix alpica TaxID=75684 RepID=A0ABV5Z9L4_9GAMM|nr:imidazolonepropionase [Balneatrix alpica]
MESLFTGCERIWTNAHLATLDPSVTEPYGALKEYALGVSQGRISVIAPMASLAGVDLERAEVIDVKGKWITPGWIDCHTHLIFAGNRANEFEQRLLGVPYSEIAKQGGGILSSVRATRAASEEELIEAARPRLEALLREGATSVEIKSGYGLTLADEIKMLRAAHKLVADYPVNASFTLLAAHALPPEFHGQADAYIEHICQDILPLVAEQRLADAVDVFCEGIGFSPAQSERLFQAATALGLAVKGHTEQLSNQHGSALVARYQGWSADHLEYLDEAGVKAMAEAGTVAVLLPGAFYFLRESKLPPIESLRKHGVPMALATDFNPGTSPLASLQLMLNMGCTLFRLTPEEALAGVTKHAAQALGWQRKLGMLRVGMQADLLVWQIEHPAQLAYEFGCQRLVQRVWQGEITHV